MLAAMVRLYYYIGYLRAFYPYRAEALYGFILQFTYTSLGKYLGFDGTRQWLGAMVSAVIYERGDTGES